MILDDLFKSKALLHMGCGSCSGGHEELAAAERVLTKLRIPFDTREFDCGCSSFAQGDDNEIMKAVEEASGLLGTKKYVIVGCGRCFYLLKHYHKAPVRHISQVISERLVAMQISRAARGEVVYHDPCYLARYGKVIDEPREVLRALGYKVLEFGNNREDTDCCGDYTPFPALRLRMAGMRLEGSPKKKALITAACPTCTTNFEDFNKTSDKKFNIKSFLQLVDSALG
ncbi:MAG: (Fe-S)-binding protein [Candidatus Altiarchaeota archaeon]|nr:(Fe-S)-binding protein [Candidatus Altiarchaeota archaeon]